MTPNVTKPDVLRALMNRCGSFFVHFDPRKPGVQIPAHLTKRAQTVFQLGHGLIRPMRDFTVSDNGFSVGLMFKADLVFVFVPWASVFALIGDDSKGCVWGPDVPPEISAQLQREALKKAPAAQKPTPADVVDARERFEEARIDGAIARNFDGPAAGAGAKVLSLVGRKPRAKA